ncbi:helix-turn-helix domain-containing protein [Bradyrhizobium sp. DASA03120]|uniref:helix-turn-helix domain-containing protein n=1 Tax=Bradyrhizobium sp. SMVTL-02 TaxID=3395917 RepID=UPI003F71DD41
MSAMTDRLGPFLAKARASSGKSLRAVERETGISNAYLSQLETGKIRAPAPQNLHRLAELYRVPYELLMELAGFPVPDTAAQPQTSPSAAGRIGPVTPDEEDELIEYLRFIRSRKRGR